MKRLVLAALAALLTAGAAQAADKLRVGAASNTWTFAPLQLGIDQGMFARAGLDVDFMIFAGAAKLQQGMVADAADIAASGSSDFVYLAKGSPEVGVGAFVGAPEGLGLIIANGPIRTAADLRGKRIGVSSPSALTGWLAMEFRRTQGWPADGIELVTLGGNVPTQGAALVTGQVSAIVSDTAMGYELEKRGQGRLLMPSSVYVKDFVTNSFFASTALAKQRPDVLRRYLAAYFEAVRFGLTHKKEMVAAGMKVSGVSDDVVGRQFDEARTMFLTDGHISPSQLANVARAVVDVGMMDHLPDFAPYYDPSFLPAAAR